MRSPEGWALANMWFDTCRTKPPYRSPLETIFVYITLRRAEQELMSTKAIIQALVAGAHPKAKMDPAIKAFEDYFDVMMPQIEKAAAEQDEAKKALIEMTKHPLKIGLQGLYKKQADAWKKTVKMKVPKAKVIRPRTRKRAGLPRIMKPRIPGAR